MHVNEKRKERVAMQVCLLMAAELAGLHRPVWACYWAEFEGPIGPTAGHDSGHLK